MSFLLKDFGQRCAYSMVHDKDSCRSMEVDHFNPTLGEESRHNYLNLMPAIRHCNGKKSDIWPSKEQRKLGLRFLNPTLEEDYGVQIFEDPATHHLFGVTPAAKYHIRYLDLNAEFLVERRRQRAEIHRQLNSPAIFTESWSKVGSGAKMIAQLRELADIGIPQIPSAPIK